MRRFFSGLFLFTTSLTLLAVAAARAENPVSHLDGCDAGGGPRDIRSLIATYDYDLDEIRLDLVLCEPPDEVSKYRVRLDHEPPTWRDLDRNGDGLVDELDLCAPTHDDLVMLHRGTHHAGPGSVRVDGAAVHYIVPLAELSPPPVPGDRVWVWADTQYRGIRDRAPTPETADGCAAPEMPGEALALDLVAPTPYLLNEVLYDGEGADADDVFTEIWGPSGVLLDGWLLIGVNGSDGSIYREIELDGAAIPGDGLLVVATSSAAGGVLAARDFVAGVDWQNGPDAVLLVDPEGAIVDALQYGEAGDHDSGEGLPAPDASGGESLTRDSAHTDTDDNATDFVIAPPSPGIA